MENHFHVGIVVEDLDVAMAEFTRAVGVHWRTPHESQYGDWKIRVSYSVEGPPYLELVEGGPDGPWDVSGGSRLDHIGYWSDDVEADSQQLADNGVPVEFDPASVGRGGFFCYHRTVATGIRLEVVKRRDMTIG